MTINTSNGLDLFDAVLDACGHDSRCGALTIRTELTPSTGHGEPVAPATLAPPEGARSGPRWQVERRWEHPEAEAPAVVVSLDQPQAQRQRIGESLERTREETGMPLIVMDFSGLELPRHIRQHVAHVRWPHRTADIYAYDALCEGQPFPEHPVGEWLLAATADEAAALFAWFPTAAAFGYWHSNLGKKRHMVRLAGAFQSEIVGWDPAVGDEPVVRKGLKGDHMNITSDTKIRRADEDDRLAGWSVADKGDSPSSIGMGQVPYGEGEKQSLRPVSFRRISQTAAIVFPQLRRLGVGRGENAQDTTARALVATLLLHGHVAAFGRPFALRSGCALSPQKTVAEFDGAPMDVPTDTVALVRHAITCARNEEVPLDGWDRDPLMLEPNSELARIINKTWPRADNGE